MKTKQLVRWSLALTGPFLGACTNLFQGPCPPHVVVTIPDGVDAGIDERGIADPAVCSSLCTENVSGWCTLESPGVLDCSNVCVGGRAPPGLKALSRVDGSVASWLARMAELEAAAVHAFIHLGRELDAHGLHDFADAARTSAAHEVRHADLIARLAMRHGVMPRPNVIHQSPIRSLAEIAIDNAGEGCGRELFGAMVNAHQAEHAKDRDVAMAMKSIASDETEHGRLSLSLAQTLMPKLDLATRRRAREAQAKVLASFTTESMPDSTTGALGLMDEARTAKTTRAILDQHRI